MRNLPADHQFVQCGTTATCLRVCLAAPRLSPIGGALLPLLPGRATGAAAAAAGHQPPPPGRSAGGPRATRSPPASPTAARLGHSPQRQWWEAHGRTSRSRQRTSLEVGRREETSERRGVRDLVFLFDRGSTDYYTNLICVALKFQSFYSKEKIRSFF
jgi:hypothetical protein